MFGGVEESVKDAMFEYGRHLGLAFQVVDDILDFTQTTEQLGKPQVRGVQTIAPAFCHPQHGVALQCQHQWQTPLTSYAFRLVIAGYVY